MSATPGTAGLGRKYRIRPRTKPTPFASADCRRIHEGRRSGRASACRRPPRPAASRSGFRSGSEWRQSVCMVIDAAEMSSTTLFKPSSISTLRDRLIVGRRGLQIEHAQEKTDDGAHRNHLGLPCGHAKQALDIDEVFAVSCVGIRQWHPLVERKVGIVHLRSNSRLQALSDGHLSEDRSIGQRCDARLHARDAEARPARRQRALTPSSIRQCSRKMGIMRLLPGVHATGRTPEASRKPDPSCRRAPARRRYWPG